MDDQPDTNFEIEQPKASRLENLYADRGDTAQNINKGYSSFIRKVQFALPVMALLLIGLIIGWNNFEGDKIVPIKEEDVQPQVKQEIGKNELVNPRFESMDEKGQPFVITADKAIQEDGDKGEMLLENPKGSMDLKNGKTVTLSALKGAYNQIEEYLDLNENVVLTHSEGYDLKTRILHIDLKVNKAWSEQPVRVTGPQGEINALGMTATSSDEKIIFKGPAKMLVHTDSDNLGFGDTLP